MDDEQPALPGMPQEITYLCPTAPSFTVWLGKPSVHCQAKNGVLKLEPHLARDLDKLMTGPKRRGDLCAVLTKVDYAKAEAAAKAHMARQRPQAAQGATHAELDQQHMIREEQKAENLTGMMNPNPAGLDDGPKEKIFEATTEHVPNNRSPLNRKK